MTGKLLRLEDVATRLGISYNQARAIVLHDEKIPFLKVGSRGIRVDAEILESYINELKHDTFEGG